MATETTGYEGRFGVVTDRRVVLSDRVGDVDIPIRHITSVSIGTIRHPWLSILFLIGAVTLAIDSFAWTGYALGALSLGIAGALFVGRPQIGIRTVDGTNRTIPCHPWQGDEADRFADAVRRQLFAEREAN